MGHSGMVEEIAILNIKNQACVKGGTSTIQYDLKKAEQFSLIDAMQYVLRPETMRTSG